MPSQGRSALGTFVASLRERVTERVRERGEQLRKRAEYFAAFIAAFPGAVLEVSQSELQLFVVHDKFPVLVRITVGPSFPKQQPSITVETVHSIKTTSQTYADNYPYSPRWSCTEMVARFISFMADEAITKLRDLASAGGAGSSSGGTAAALPSSRI